jgi:uncharacterized protein YggT (Ycf19 family)
MAFYAWIIAIAAFLSVITVIVFVMLVVGIHMRDRTRRLHDAPETVLDAFTRSFLGVGVRHSDSEEN